MVCPPIVPKIRLKQLHHLPNSLVHCVDVGQVLLRAGLVPVANGVQAEQMEEVDGTRGGQLGSGHRISLGRVEKILKIVDLLIYIS